MDDFIASLPALPQLSSLGYCQNSINRHAIKRGEHEVLKAHADKRAKTYLLQEGKILFKQSTKGCDPLFTLSEAKQFQLDAEQTVLLGYEGDEPRFAMAALEPLEPLAALDTPYGVENLRSLAMGEMVALKHQGALALAHGLLTWHKSHRFCAKCGAQSQMMDGGYRRLCPSCETEHFPRTDPVVIMLIVKEGHCLLGAGHNFSERRYSALAGFMEPGETLEDAVRRETFEEAGIRVGDVHYLTSQPWPMPHSLMIGCFGIAENFDIKIDDEELRDCQWFAKEDVFKMRDGSHPNGFETPPDFAIAAALINHWLNL